MYANYRVSIKKRSHSELHYLKTGLTKLTKCEKRVMGKKWACKKTCTEWPLKWPLLMFFVVLATKIAWLEGRHAAKPPDGKLLTTGHFSGRSAHIFLLAHFLPHDSLSKHIKFHFISLTQSWDNFAQRVGAFLCSRCTLYVYRPPSDHYIYIVP